MSRATEILKKRALVLEATDPKVKSAIQGLIDTNFSGSNQEQGKAVALFKGLAFSDDAAANKFMTAVDKATSAMKVDTFTEGSKNLLEFAALESVLKIFKDKEFTAIKKGLSGPDQKKWDAAVAFISQWVKIELEG